jgi:hypothetical protein
MNLQDEVQSGNVHACDEAMTNLSSRIATLTCKNNALATVRQLSPQDASEKQTSFTVIAVQKGYDASWRNRQNRYLQRRNGGEVEVQSG